MKAHADKKRESQRQPMADSLSRKQNKGQADFGFTDNRPAAETQKTLKGLMGPQTAQFQIPGASEHSELKSGKDIPAGKPFQFGEIGTRTIAQRKAGAGVIQRVDENLEKAYDLFVAKLKTPLSSLEFQILLGTIDQEYDCIVEENEMGHDDRGTWFIIEIESMSSHRIMDYFVLKTTEEIASACANEVKGPEPRESRDRGVRVIFGRGTTFEYDGPDEDDEITPLERSDCTHYIHADSREFGANQPGDYSVDINENVDPNVLGSITDPDTFSQLATFLGNTGNRIRFIGIEYVPASVWDTSDARKKTREGIALLKRFSIDDVPIVTKPSGILELINTP